VLVKWYCDSGSWDELAPSSLLIRACRGVHKCSVNAQEKYILCAVIGEDVRM
jgi:hypothetical protein